MPTIPTTVDALKICQRVNFIRRPLARPATYARFRAEQRMFLISQSHFFQSNLPSSRELFGANAPFCVAVPAGSHRSAEKSHVCPMHCMQSEWSRLERSAAHVALRKLHCRYSAPLRHVTAQPRHYNLRDVCGCHATDSRSAAVESEMRRDGDIDMRQSARRASSRASSAPVFG